MHFWSCNYATIRSLKRGNSINQSIPGMRHKLLCVLSGRSSCTNTSLKVIKTLINPLIGRIQIDITCWCGTGKNRALAYHHNLQDLMLGASSDLEVSETLLSKQRKLEETEEGMTSTLSRVASSSGVFTKCMRIESRLCSKSSIACLKKE